MTTRRRRLTDHEKGVQVLNSAVPAEIVRALAQVLSIPTVGILSFGLLLVMLKNAGIKGLQGFIDVCYGAAVAAAVVPAAGPATAAAITGFGLAGAGVGTGAAAAAAPGLGLPLLAGLGGLLPAIEAATRPRIADIVKRIAEEYPLDRGGVIPP